MQHSYYFCFRIIVFLCALIFLSTSHANNLSDKEKTEFFNTQVKPILEENCLQCHGGRTEVEGGLDLTNREKILEGGHYGATVSLDNPNQSLLLEMVGYNQETAQMPPDGKLDDASLEILAKWINIGLPYPTLENDTHPNIDSASNYWAYLPLTQPSIPSVHKANWVLNPIDSFILAKLEANGLTPAAPATKLSLIRRVYYDLTGLPPSPEAVDAFLNNTAPDAYEKLIDKLLKSPRYGEKWGRHWLDLVRYAETNGYESDSDKPYIWRYRDYVINSFNQDKPYDQFLKEQLAGDELDTATSETVIATGYHKLGVWDTGPADRKLARYNYLDDIVSTTGQVMLGMTIGCARCHDHKIDPISMQDYYSFLAFFHDIRPHNGGPLADIGSPEQQAERNRLLTEKRQAEEEYHDQLFHIQENIKIELAKIHSEPIAPNITESPIQNLTYRFYRGIFEQIPSDFDSLELTAEGRLFSNLFSLAPANPKKNIGLVFVGTLQVAEDATYTFHLNLNGEFRLILNGQLVSELSGDSETQLALETGDIPIRLEYFNKDLDKPSLEISWSAPNIERQFLSTTANINFGKLLNTHKDYIESNEELKSLVDKYNVIKQQRDQRHRQRIPYEHQALVVTEDSQTPTHILRRGNPTLVGREVNPAFPSVLNPPVVETPVMPKESKTSGKRRVFAEWVAKDDNPLTARVMVNRIWQYHFGRGIVRTSNDFGQLGSPPTHPELLDWLASEFITSGWKIKAMHKLIMTSNTYQMSTQSNPTYIHKDANNDLFWRFNMRRLTAEEIRDTVLWITGKLNLKMAGPSIYPELPEEVLATASRPGSVWGQSPPDETNRRSVYVKVKRSLLVPILNLYDQANTDSTCPVRFTTTVPTQSLTMLNGKFINEQAHIFANRMRWEGGITIEDRVKYGLRLVLCREPEQTEIQHALNFISELQQQNGVTTDIALDRFALLALNLNEFIFLD
ncbi:DUF1553 domain-containing protein [Candidatus Poribacteria bacterium]|nr:DUF1553 domain-containing protein [Candidatus Poribacteria bacterium]